MVPIATVIEDGQPSSTLRVWRNREGAREGEADYRRPGATLEWRGGEPGRPTSHLEPISGPVFDPGVYLEPPMVQPRPGANGDGIPESARSRENPDTHAVMAFDLFATGR